MTSAKLLEEWKREKKIYELGYNAGLNLLLEPDLRPVVDYNEKESKLFVRGFFESCGNIIRKEEHSKSLVCSLNIRNSFLMKYFLDSMGISEYETLGEHIFLYDSNAFDFLSKIFDCKLANQQPKGEKYQKYIEWATFGFQQKIPCCKFFKAESDAVIPTKERASDVGYDLTIIKEIKKIGSKTFMYDTGIVVAPDFGYYTKIVPRSSITKSGYMLTNSMGIIDGSYRGTLKICLTKIDDSIPNLTLPCKIAQLIIDRSIHYTINEVSCLEELGETTRGEGGFGSTDVKK